MGFGSYKLPDSAEGAEIVAQAINTGYTLIDGAAAYENEKAVGNGIRLSEADRERLFITSKVRNSDRGFDSTLRAFDKTLSDLGLDYLDLYLVHWPADAANDPEWQKTNLDTWRALERLYAEGRTRAIGVCNFMPEHLEALLSKAAVSPAINQIEFNPGMQQPECIGLCQRNNIIVEAWSPLARGRIFENEILKDIASAHQASVAQICLAWEHRKHTIPIPKSSTPERMKENLAALDISLSPDEISRIDSLSTFGNSGLTAANIVSHH